MVVYRLHSTLMLGRLALAWYHLNTYTPLSHVILGLSSKHRVLTPTTYHFGHLTFMQVSYKPQFWMHNSKWKTQCITLTWPHITHLKFTCVTIATFQTMDGRLCNTCSNLVNKSTVLNSKVSRKLTIWCSLPSCVWEKLVLQNVREKNIENIIKESIENCQLQRKLRLQRVR